MENAALGSEHHGLGAFREGRAGDAQDTLRAAPAVGSLRERRGSK